MQWDYGAAAYWKVIPFPKIVNHWATTSGVLCVVGKDLQCAQGQRLAAAPPEPASPPGSKAGKAPGKVTAARCLRCAPPKYPQWDRAAGVSGEVLLHALIAKDGRVQDITLLAAPSAGLAQAAMQTVSGWLYQPTTLNGQPAEVDTKIAVNFMLAR